MLSLRAGADYIALMPKSSARSQDNLLSVLPLIAATATRPPAIPVLERRALKLSKLRFTPKWAGKWLGVGETDIEKRLLPLLRICRENFRICSEHRKDPAWSDCFRVCTVNFEIMEAKWANSVEASKLMR